MITYTGDTHGQTDKILHFVERFELTEHDAIVILGDAGINYYGNDHGDRRIKRRLNDSGVTIFCIHGNHERRPASLPYYREGMWHGGAVYVEDDYPNLLFARDGEIYDLDSHPSLVIGGAYSVDKHYRQMRGLHWFDDEQPSQQTKDHVESVLDGIGWKIDTVLSHTCPYKAIPVEAFLPGLDQSKVDNSTERWLDDIEGRLSYSHWLCGHWHIDKRLDRFHFLMDSFEML